jgi:hypothetical protein
MIRRPIAGLPVLLALLAACDIPSATPQWGTTWNVPGQSTSISVNSLLPTGVTANGTNTAFQVAVNPITITEGLGQDCAACAALNGQTVPKPAFSATSNGAAPLPVAVNSATLVADTLTVTITNGFGFDPLNPSKAAGSATGFLVTSVTSGATVIGKDSANGASGITLPPNGGVLVRKIVLSGTVSGAAGVTATVTINSPAGDPTIINTSQTISIRATAGTLSIASVTINPTTVIPSSPTTIDFSGVGSAVSSRVKGGFLILSITNPLGIGGNLTAKFTVGPAQVLKPLTLSSAPTSTDTLNFTTADLANLLGYNLQLSFSGTVSGSTTITPGQIVAVTSRLQLNLVTVSQ